MSAGDILATALDLASGQREAQHGPKLRNHRNIAHLWSAFLVIRRDVAAPLSPSDVALMMALAKIARSQLGGFNLDDYVDGAAYVAIAGECDEKVGG